MNTYLLQVDLTQSFFIYLTAGIIVLAIYYWLISSAVSTGVKKSDYIKLLGRAKAFELLQQGESVEKIKDLFNDDEVTFWKKNEVMGRKKEKLKRLIFSPSPVFFPEILR